ncbi:hypothetical protein ACFO5X_19645 [Seohaeicola nanhaiensis]|uniref:Lipoprotein n=1 Tax=Seohaeicola nanhaiensis TaxID=1387282 RepID=A0ABV9KL10_9RHOB
MKSLAVIGLSACVVLAGCVEPIANSRDKPVDAARLPDDVRAMAAPGQDLSEVRILAEDGCYWYRYAGPVETTLLPLRTQDGRPICTRAQ